MKQGSKQKSSVTTYSYDGIAGEKIPTLACYNNYLVQCQSNGKVGIFS